MRGLKVFLMVAVVVALVAPASVADAQHPGWVKIDCGKVVKAMGNTVVIRLDSNNKTKVFKKASGTFKISSTSPSRGECRLVTDDGGKGPSRHRLLHITLPDGRWVLREVGLIMGGEGRADEIEAALNTP